MAMIHRESEDVCGTALDDDLYGSVKIKDATGILFQCFVSIELGFTQTADTSSIRCRF